MPFSLSYKWDKVFQTLPAPHRWFHIRLTVLKLRSASLGRLKSEPSIQVAMIDHLALHRSPAIAPSPMRPSQPQASTYARPPSSHLCTPPAVRGEDAGRSHRSLRLSPRLPLRRTLRLALGLPLGLLLECLGGNLRA